MFLLKVVTKDGTKQADYSTYEECVQHFEKYKALGHYGKDEHQVFHPEIPQKPAIPLIPEKPAYAEYTYVDHAEVPAVMNGDIVIKVAIPAYTETVIVHHATIPAVYASDVVDGLTPIIPAYSETIPCEYSYEIIDTSAQIKSEEAIKYLAETDYYVVRFAETGVAIPDSVKLKRQQAREEVIK